VPAPSKKELAKRKKEMRESGSLTVPERLAVEQGGKLHSKLFQRSLDDLLSRATRIKTAEGPEIKNGLLFILRNEPPTFLLGERALKQHASALYHEDVSIVDYIENVRTRRALARDKKTRHRICMLLPGNLETLIRGIDAGLQHPSQSESSGEMEALRDSDLLWDELKGQCESWASGDFKETVRSFHAPDGVEEVEGLPDGFGKLSTVARDWLGLDEESKIKPSLPDCWIWMSNKFLGFDKELDDPRIEDSRRRLCLTLPRHINKGGTRSESERAEREIAKSLQEDELRMVAVSRSRYNPRFRGRIIAEPRQAQELLLRAALCIVASKPFGEPTGPTQRGSSASSSTLRS
jgi:hypothetical protein